MAPIGRSRWLQFGGIRPGLSYYAGRVAARSGLYARYEHVDWSRAKRLVFVCSGNVCRSPYASERARAFGVQAASCGTTAIDGARADPSAVRLAADRNLRLDAHRSTSLARLELSPTDLLLAAEPQHARALDELATRSRAQLTLLGLWSKTPSTFIPDPFGKPDACFAFVFGLIDQAVANIVGRIVAPL